MNTNITVAIIGRPNVGKSALFNRICRRRQAIVDEAEGVTRDRLYGEADVFGTEIRVIDTGGIDPKGTAPFNEAIRQQALLALEEADAAVLVVDSRVGVTALDSEVAQLVRCQGKPVILAVNKVDNLDQEELVYPFYGLGIKTTLGVSAQHGHGVADLLQAVVEQTEPPTDEDSKSLDAVRVALVGRPNAGKSSLINTLLDAERCIVSPIPGTTRDSIDVPVTDGHHNYILVDTAGIRRKNAEHEAVDKFAAIRTERAIERSDVCLLLLDAQAGMSTQDKRIARDIEKAGKGCVLLFNKWDLVHNVRMEHCLRQLEEEVPFLRHCPRLCISALTGRNVEKILPQTQEVYQQSLRRVPTAELNRVIKAAMEKTHPPMIRGKRLRVYYLTQVEVSPPSFTLFVNHTDRLDDTYKRYLYNQLRKAHPFTGVPLRMFIRGKKEKTTAGTVY